MNNIMRYLLLFFLHIYRKIISPIFPPVCRFHPTCSAYAHHALVEYGPWKGAFLSIKRIFRCQPFYKGPVIDPVPPKKK